MPELFLSTVARFVTLAWRVYFPAADDAKSRVSYKLLMLLLLPLFALLLAVHWLGFLLDEIFYRRYRSVAIKQAVFVLGVPRSGTTYLHRVLSENKRFTTFTTWECLFAPSISQRKFFFAIGVIDKRVGKPLKRLLTFLEDRLASGLDGIHVTRLDAAEEDYLTLLPILACFILILPFPHAQHVWQMGAFDRDMPQLEKKRILAWYRMMLQKHLYVHGTDKQLLSKNAAFASLAASLCDEFPDARILCCMRDPLQALPSQLSSLQAGIDIFGGEAQRLAAQKNFLQLFPYYYNHLLDTLPEKAKDRHVMISMQALQNDLYTVVKNAIDVLAIDTDDEFDEKLARLGLHGRSYVSHHNYSISGLGLTEQELKQRFASVYEKYRFA